MKERSMPLTVLTGSDVSDRIYGYCRCCYYIRDGREPQAKTQLEALRQTVVRLIPADFTGKAALGGVLVND